MTRPWVWVVVAALFASIAWVAFHSRSETLSRTADRWTGANERREIAEANEMNGGVLYPNPQDIIDGAAEVRPLPKPDASVEVKGALTLRWGSQPFACELLNERSARENGEQFATRAGSDATAMLRAFPAR